MVLLPTRTFVVIVDPGFLEAGPLRSGLREAMKLVAALANLEPAVTIQLVLPAYLADERQLSTVIDEDLPITFRFDEGPVRPVTLSRRVSRRARERIERGADDECRGIRLLSLADHVNADAILTEIRSLVDARYELLSFHKFRIVPPGEFSDFVEVCGRGHGVPCSATSHRDLPPDLLYVFTHWKGRRLAAWFNKVAARLADGTLKECLRSALLNRYPFILIARDSVRFYELQTHHHFRHTGERGEFHNALNYHLTAFYFHVWGMLDSLTGIANLHLGLGLEPRQCGISSDDFLNALKQRCPNLFSFIKTYSARWVSVIADVRHPAAHSALLLQRDVLEDTPESRKTDDEILAILKAEDPNFFVRNEAYTRSMFPSFIWLWRVKHMTVITDDAIYVELPSRGYIRAAAISIDWDLGMLNAFIDAFLISCFGHP